MRWRGANDSKEEEEEVPCITASSFQKNSYHLANQRFRAYDNMYYLVDKYAPSEGVTGDATDPRSQKAKSCSRLSSMV